MESFILIYHQILCSRSTNLSVVHFWNFRNRNVWVIADYESNVTPISRIDMFQRWISQKCASWVHYKPQISTWRSMKMVAGNIWLALRVPGVSRFPRDSYKRHRLCLVSPSYFILTGSRACVDIYRRYVTQCAEFWSMQHRLSLISVIILFCTQFRSLLTIIWELLCKSAKGKACGKKCRAHGHFGETTTTENIAMGFSGLCSLSLWLYIPTLFTSCLITERWKQKENIFLAFL